MSASTFQLIVGLGNPGGKYLETRHNIGFMVLQELAKKQSITFKKEKKFHGELAEFHISEQRVLLLMPNTYMNESGKSIRATLDWFGLEKEKLLVIVDDIDLPLGRLRLRSKGSAGGHNGLKSTITHLANQDFCRLRIGIGAPICLPEEKKSKTVSHVLGSFTAKEKPLVQEIIDEVVKGINLIQTLGFDKAGNKLNSYQPKTLE